MGGRRDGKETRGPKKARLEGERASIGESMRREARSGLLGDGCEGGVMGGVEYAVASERGKLGTWLRQ